MKLFKKYFYLCFIFLFLSSCKDNVVDAILADDILYNMAYSDLEWPADFYHEDLNGGSIYYENTLSIKPLEQRKPSSVQLCTDIKDEARAWSDSSSRNSSFYRELISEKETEKYYEFRRVYSGISNDILLSRVHKCSYLNRSMYDPFISTEGLIGIFNKNSFNQNDVKELIEYLWFVEPYRYGGKVYSSKIENSGSEYVYIFYSIEISYGDWGVKDEIRNYKSTFHVGHTTGEIVFSKELLKKIPGKQR